MKINSRQAQYTIPMRPSVVGCAILFCLTLSLPLSVAAQTTISESWLGGDGNWSRDTSWNVGVVPNNTATNSYNVLINPVSHSTVKLDQDVVVTGLNIGTHGHLDSSFNSYALTTGTLANQGALGLFLAGPLNVNHALDNSGSVFLGLDTHLNVGGNLNNSGTVDSAEAGFLTVHGDLSNSNSISNSGTTRIDGNVNNSGKYSQYLWLNVGGGFNNNGRFDAFGTSTISGALNNSGTVRTGLSFLTVGSLNNSGNIENYGSIASAGDINNSGRIDIAQLRVTAAGNLNNSGTITVLGSVDVGGNASNSGIMEMLGSLNATSYSQTGLWQEDFSQNTVIGQIYFGTMNLTGDLDLGGTLAFDFLNGFMPSFGESFLMATFAPGHLSGGFSSILGNSFNNDQWMFNIDYDNHDGQILLTVVDKPRNVPEPATWALLFLAVPFFRHARKVKRG
jgi:hypothetical protein